jgi:hypothetical protein
MKKIIFILFALLIFSKNLKAVEPVFNYIDSNWMSEPLFYDMSAFWQNYGLQETGVNYYFFAKAQNNWYWERFNPLNPRYQSWFGVYVMDNFEFKNEWYKGHRSKKKSLQRAIEFVEYGSESWLRDMGIPEELNDTKIIPSSIYCYKDKNGWYKAFFITKTRSDLGGDYNPEIPFIPGFDSFSRLINPYHKIIMYWEILFKYDKKNNKFLMIYSNLSKWKLINGQWIYPTWELIKEKQKMIKGVTFR